MIPTNNQDAVKKSLKKTFGVTIYEDIQQLTKGLSGSLVFKITVHSIPYLLRVITRTDSRDKPIYYFGCMQAAADAGLAPKIHYLSIEDRISITDFIEEQPFLISDAREKMADVVRHLHSLPKFNSQLNYVDAADDFLQKFRASNIVPETATKTLFELYLRISKAYPRNDKENMVSSHNDIKPDNIIFDGTRPWLVDWEAARLNDRYLDLAAIANFVVKNDKDEADFLERYFGGIVDEYKQARFFLMSNIVHMFCFTLCTILVSSDKPINIKMNHPDFSEFHNRLWKGEINLANNDEKLQYGLVHLEELQRKMQTTRFDESLRIVTEYENFR
jgi:thiamine kinase-like enzyme